MKVLIVEDDMMLGELLQEYLQRLNHERVRVCLTGEEACSAIHEEVFDCSFMDLRLPDTDGIRLLEFVKQQDPSMPVVMMSGYPTMEYTIEAMRKGASDFLTKPFTLQDVALTLERVIKERKLLLENLTLQLESQSRKQLEAVNRELQEKVQEQVKLFEISREIDEIRSSDDLYGCIVRLASKLTALEKASFFLMPPEQNDLILIADHGMNLCESYPRFFKGRTGRMKEILDSNASYIVLKAHELKEELLLREDLVLEDFAFSCWPLKIRGELFGFLMASHLNGARSISLTETRLLDFLVKKAAMAIENMALYESLIGNFYGILKSLVNALEAKDLYTGKHSERVTRYAVQIGRMLGCNGSQIEALRTVGYLHDIGKIGVSDRILNKAGALTKEEFQLVKEHPVIGDGIVAELGLTAEERSIIRHHHERWDGQGYPDKLAGQDIPLLARVIAVADAFDAMTSIRAYRNAMTVREAIAELRENRGKQFDPDALDAFIESFEKPVKTSLST